MTFIRRDFALPVFRCCCQQGGLQSARGWIASINAKSDDYCTHYKRSKVKRMDQTGASSDQPADQFFASLYYTAVKENFASNKRTNYFKIIRPDNFLMVDRINVIKYKQLPASGFPFSAHQGSYRLTKIFSRLSMISFSMVSSSKVSRV